MTIEATEGVPAVSWSSDMGLLGMGCARDVNCIFGFYRGFKCLFSGGSDSFIATPADEPSKTPDVFLG